MSSILPIRIARSPVTAVPAPAWADAGVPRPTLTELGTIARVVVKEASGAASSGDEPSLKARFVYETAMVAVESSSGGCSMSDAIRLSEQCWARIPGLVDRQAAMEVASRATNVGAVLGMAPIHDDAVEDGPVGVLDLTG